LIGWIISKEEIESLLEDQVYFDALVNTSPHAIELQQVQELRLATTIQIARKSLASADCTGQPGLIQRE